VSFQDFLDSLPISVVFVAYVLVAAVVSEGGYRLGRWWQDHTPEEREGPTPMIVGSLLGLMGFMLAITTGMAADRFDTRRGLVLAEANSVGTTYLRAGYLPEPASSNVRNMLREYVPLRIVSDDLANVQEGISRSVQIQARLWSIAEELARATPESDVLVLYIDSLNEMIDVHETRVVAGIYARVPETLLLLLLCGSIVTLGMVGYNAGLTRRRSTITAVVMVVFLGAVVTFVVDLDRPRDGLLQVNQQPLIDLQEQIGEPVSSSSPR
jgi:hypothetical protein